MIRSSQWLVILPVLRRERQGTMLHGKTLSVSHSLLSQPYLSKPPLQLATLIESTHTLSSPVSISRTRQQAMRADFSVPADRAMAPYTCGHSSSRGCGGGGGGEERRRHCHLLRAATSFLSLPSNPADLRQPRPARLTFPTSRAHTWRDTE